MPATAMCLGTRKSTLHEFGISADRRRDYGTLRLKVSHKTDNPIWDEPKTSGKLIVLSRPVNISPIVARFRKRSLEWHTETDGLSALEDVITHPAYLNIIGIGEPAIPLILKEMQEHGGRWQTALEAITEHNPVTPENVGFARKTKEAWLKWGRKNHYI